MSRQSISFTNPNSEWLDRKVNIEQEYKSNSEAVNDLIRKAREIEGIRARLVQYSALTVILVGLSIIWSAILVSRIYVPNSGR